MALICAIYLPACLLQDRKLDISLNLPPVLSTDPTFLHYAYTTKTGTLATLTGSVNALGKCFEGFVSQATGATSAELEASQRYTDNATLVSC